MDKITESLLTLAASSDIINHELFHLYHDIDAKIRMLDYFWKNKLDSLEWEYNCIVDYFSIYNENAIPIFEDAHFFFTDLLFGYSVRTVNSAFQGTSKFSREIKHSLIHTGCTITNNITLDYIYDYLFTIIQDNHEEYHQ